MFEPVPVPLGGCGVRPTNWLTRSRGAVVQGHGAADVEQVEGLADVDADARSSVTLLATSRVLSVPATPIAAPGFSASKAIRSTVPVPPMVRGPSRSAEWNRGPPGCAAVDLERADLEDLGRPAVR